MLSISLIKNKYAENKDALSVVYMKLNQKDTHN